MIRKMEEKDLQEMGMLLKQVYADEPWNDTWSVEQATTYLTELWNHPKAEGYVFVQDSQILGVCLGHYKTWYDGIRFVLEEFFISSTLHGIGIGSQIIQFLKEYLKKKEVCSIELWTGRNFPAQGFYEKQNFTIQDDIVTMQCLLKKLS